MASIVVPPERAQAWEKYKKHFGKNYPAYYKHMVFRDNWQKEVADIERRIMENKPAPEKDIPDDVQL